MALSTLRRGLAPLADALRGLFVGRCVLCAGGTGGLWCDACRDELAGAHAPRCPLCAEQTSGAQVCGRCLRHPPAFSRALAVASYAFPLDAVILRLKYGKDLALARPLAGLLIERVRLEAKPDVVIGMPLSARRMRERGFNQANEIARRVAAALSTRFEPAAVVRVRDAAPQASLPLDQRAGNVKGAFAVEGSLAGRTVAVVDDVLTTGASLNELALTLRRAGATEVVGWVLARTPQLLSAGPPAAARRTL
jgi:ComF family protein